MSAQQLAAFPFPGSAHMLGLAGFAALGQQLNGNSNGFAPPKSEMQVDTLPKIRDNEAISSWVGLLPNRTRESNLVGTRYPLATEDAM